MAKLARFRVDPTELRVSIVRNRVGYVVTIAERAGAERRVTGASRIARSAILRALLAAQAKGLVGIDMTMSLSYPHPQYINVGTGYDVTLYPSVRQNWGYGTRH